MLLHIVEDLTFNKGEKMFIVDTTRNTTRDRREIFNKFCDKGPHGPTIRRAKKDEVKIDDPDEDDS